MEKRREEIMGRYQKIQEDLAPIIDLFENENVVAEISKNSNRPEALRDSLAPYGVSGCAGRGSERRKAGDAAALPCAHHFHHSHFPPAAVCSSRRR